MEAELKKNTNKNIILKGKLDEAERNAKELQIAS
jgi:hypothetical protein